MSLISTLRRAFIGESPEPELIEHVAIRDSAKDWRDERVIQAAARHNRPFLCGPDTVRREVLIDGQRLATVIPLRRK